MARSAQYLIVADNIVNLRGLFVRHKKKPGSMTPAAETSNGGSVSTNEIIGLLILEVNLSKVHGLTICVGAVYYDSAT